MLRIYYNPKCSKSRAALQRLEAAGLTPEVVNYMKNPPSRDQLESLANKLVDPVTHLLREAPDAEEPSSSSAVIAALMAAPEIMQRPIVETQTTALIARDPKRLDSFVNAGETAS